MQYTDPGDQISNTSSKYGVLRAPIHIECKLIRFFRMDTNSHRGRSLHRTIPSSSRNKSQAGDRQSRTSYHRIEDLCCKPTKMNTGCCTRQRIVDRKARKMDFINALWGEYDIDLREFDSDISYDEMLESENSALVEVDSHLKKLRNNKNKFVSNGSERIKDKFAAHISEITERLDAMKDFPFRSKHKKVLEVPKNVPESSMIAAKSKRFMNREKELEDELAKIRAAKAEKCALEFKVENPNRKRVLLDQLASGRINMKLKRYVDQIMSGKLIFDVKTCEKTAAVTIQSKLRQFISKRKSRKKALHVNKHSRKHSGINNSSRKHSEIGEMVESLSKFDFTLARVFGKQQNSCASFSLHIKEQLETEIAMTFNKRTQNARRVQKWFRALKSKEKMVAESQLQFRNYQWAKYWQDCQEYEFQNAECKEQIEYQDNVVQHQLDIDEPREDQVKYHENVVQHQLEIDEPRQDENEFQENLTQHQLEINERCEDQVKYQENVVQHQQEINEPREGSIENLLPKMCDDDFAQVELHQGKKEFEYEEIVLEKRLFEKENARFESMDELGDMVFANNPTEQAFDFKIFEMENEEVSSDDSDDIESSCDDGNEDEEFDEECIDAKWQMEQLNIGDEATMNEWTPNNEWKQTETNELEEYHEAMHSDQVGDQLPNSEEEPVDPLEYNTVHTLNQDEEYIDAKWQMEQFNLGDEAMMNELTPNHDWKQTETDQLKEFHEAMQNVQLQDQLPNQEREPVENNTVHFVNQDNIPEEDHLDFNEYMRATEPQSAVDCQFDNGVQFQNEYPFQNVVRMNNEIHEASWGAIAFGEAPGLVPIGNAGFDTTFTPKSRASFSPDVEFSMATLINCGFISVADLLDRSDIIGQSVKMVRSDGTTDDVQVVSVFEDKEKMKCVCEDGKMVVKKLKYFFCVPLEILQLAGKDSSSHRLKIDKGTFENEDEEEREEIRSFDMAQFEEDEVENNEFENDEFENDELEKETEKESGNVQARIGDWEICHDDRGGQFYFNVLTKHSQWGRPEELYGQVTKETSKTETSDKLSVLLDEFDLSKMGPTQTCSQLDDEANMMF